MKNKVYKDAQGKYVFFPDYLKEDGSLNTELVEITDEEHNEMLSVNNNLIEATRYLNATDYKDLPNYQPKDGEVLADIITERNTKRDYIRNNT